LDLGEIKEIITQLRAFQVAAPPVTSDDRHLPMGAGAGALVGGPSAEEEVVGVGEAGWREETTGGVDGEGMEAEIRRLGRWVTMLGLRAVGSVRPNEGCFPRSLEGLEMASEKEERIARMSGATRTQVAPPPGSRGGVTARAATRKKNGSLFVSSTVTPLPQVRDKLADMQDRARTPGGGKGKGRCDDDPTDASSHSSAGSVSSAFGAAPPSRVTPPCDAPQVSGIDATKMSPSLSRQV
jgi:hypothetical protein